jgi:hypothetical protein
MAAVLAAGAVMATAGPASAERYRHYRHHRGGDNDEVAAAIIGGVAGLALGAALSGNSSRRDRGGSYYDNGYRYDPRYDSYSRGYYRGGGYYDDGYYDRGRRYSYRTCVTRDRVYDPYIGRRVVIERRYAC